MRKIYILLVLVLLSVQMRSQGVRFIEEGKIWHVEQNICGLLLYHDFGFTAESDTLINDVHYMRLFELGKDKKTIKGYFREENGVVYCYRPALKREDLCYNFKVKLGSTYIIPFTFWNSDALCSSEVKAVDTYTLKNGASVRMIKLISSFITEIEGEDNYPDVWIEGVGNLAHPCANIMANAGNGSICRVLSVKVGDKEIYSATKTGIEVPETNKDGRAYDMQGRPLPREVQRGFYIKDGRKFWKK